MKSLCTMAATILMGLTAVSLAQMGKPMRMTNMASVTTQPSANCRMQQCQAMMQRMQRMQSRMKRMDQKLQQKIDTMKQAQGDARIPAMEAVIEEMAQQHMAMNRQHAKMMKGAVQRLSRCRNGCCGKTMMKCPMMAPTTQPAKGQSGSAQP